MALLSGESPSSRVEATRIFITFSHLPGMAVTPVSCV